MPVAEARVTSRAYSQMFEPVSPANDAVIMCFLPLKCVFHWSPEFLSLRETATLSGFSREIKFPIRAARWAGEIATEATCHSHNLCSELYITKTTKKFSDSSTRRSAEKGSFTAIMAAMIMAEAMETGRENAVVLCKNLLKVFPPRSIQHVILEEGTSYGFCVCERTPFLNTTPTPARAFVTLDTCHMTSRGHSNAWQPPRLGRNWVRERIAGSVPTKFWKQFRWDVQGTNSTYWHYKPALRPF